MRRALLSALCALLLACLVAPAVATAAEGAHGTRVVVAFLPGAKRNPALPYAVRKNLAPTSEINYKRLQNRPQLALGLLNATQGSYSDRQALLDYTQGTRTSVSTYDPPDVPRVRLIQSMYPGKGYMDRWTFERKRAATAPADIFPGLLASSIPGGAAYVGPTSKHSQNLEALMAADQTGHIASLSLGDPETVVARTQRELRTHKLVVVGLSAKRPGGRQLDGILAARKPDELVIVMQTPPDSHSSQMLGIGIAGLGDTRSLTSVTTRRSNIVAGIDLAPTILDYLGIEIPDAMSGQVITTTGTRPTAAELDAFRNRLYDLGGRRIPTLELMLLTWLALAFALGTLGGWHATRRRSLRIGALAMFWIPVAVLFTAVFQPPSVIAEAGVIGVLCFGAGALTDRYLRWPRGPLLPAAVTLIAYVIDMFRNSSVIVRSLLGPNPRFGSRFYGVGNELETILTIVFLIGAAAALSYAIQSRRNAVVVGIVGACMGVVICSGRLGADVGGVFTVASGTAVMVLTMLPGRPSRRAVAISICSPIAALVALAALDLASGGNGHFTRTVLDAHSFKDLKETFDRRNELAFGNLIRGRTPAIVLAGAIATAFVWRNRRWLLEPIIDKPAWRGGLLGSLVASIVGSLTNDSGALMFIIAIFVLAFVVAYIQGDPRLAADAGRVMPVTPTRRGLALADPAARAVAAGASPSGAGAAPPQQPATEPSPAGIP